MIAAYEQSEEFTSTRITEREKTNVDRSLPGASSKGVLLLVLLALGVVGAFALVEHRGQEKADAILEGDRASDQGNYDLAIADYNQAIQLGSNIATTYNARGIAHQRKGDYEKAIADYSMAVHFDPQEVTY